MNETQVAAQQAAMRRYAERHDLLSEHEQILVLEGHEQEAAVIHRVCVRLLRAWAAEGNDPEPRPEAEAWEA